MMFRILLLVIALMTVTETVAATMPPLPLPGPEISAFRELIRVPAPAILVPTVVEVPLSYVADRRNFLVIDNGTGSAVPSYFREEYTFVPASVSASVVINGNSSAFWVLLDDDSETGLEFLIAEDGRGDASIALTTSKPVTASAFSFDFGKNALLAATVEVRALVGGQMQIVLPEVPLKGERVDFTPIFSDTWIITLKYLQPLSVNEVRLFQDDIEESITRGIRFLAQPGSSYTLYHNPDRFVRTSFSEQGNLSDNEGVLMVGGIGSEPNPAFVLGDGDRDDIPDITDNCVSVSNTDQADIDRSGRGDACEDFDRDGYMNSADNCPNLPNYDQRDIDGDGMGDICDSEESRLTERLPWVPWVGMGLAAIVLAVLFVIVARRPLLSETDTSHDANTPV